LQIPSDERSPHSSLSVSPPFPPTPTAGKNQQSRLDGKLIHRDLKPENIFVVKDGEAAGGERAKILDFGIARLEDPSGEGRRTTAGVAIGTPTYMAPEQCEGSSTINDRVDVYSLGVMSFELLTGAPPFQSDSMAAVLRMHIVREPPPLPTTIPAALATLIGQMLAKEAKERPSMAEVAQRLEDLFGGRGSSTAIPVMGTGPRSRQPTIVAAATVAVLAAGLAGYLLLGRKSSTPVVPPPPRPQIEAPQKRPDGPTVTAPKSPDSLDKSGTITEPTGKTPSGPNLKTGPKPPKREPKDKDKDKGDVLLFHTKKKSQKGTPP
jgi:serine/threonine protein kinase